MKWNKWSEWVSEWVTDSHEWMNERTNEWMKEMNERTNEWTKWNQIQRNPTKWHEWMNEWAKWMNEWMNEMNEWMNERTNERMNEWSQSIKRAVNQLTNQPINQWINEFMNHKANEPMKQWIFEPTNESTNEPVNSIQTARIAWIPHSSVGWADKAPPAKRSRAAWSELEYHNRPCTGYVMRKSTEWNSTASILRINQPSMKQRHKVKRARAHFEECM